MTATTQPGVNAAQIIHHIAWARYHAAQADAAASVEQQSAHAAAGELHVSIARFAWGWPSTYGDLFAPAPAKESP